MSDDPRFPHVRVPLFILDAEKYRGVTASHLATYLAARSFAYFRSRASERFARCWPSLESIAQRARQSTRTVGRNLTDLDRWCLISRRRRFNSSSMIYFVDFPERFKVVLAARGREAAQREVEDRLDEIVEDARREEAKKAKRHRASDATGRIWPAKNKHQSGADSSDTGRESPNPTPPPAQMASTPPPGWPPKNDLVEELSREEHTSDCTPSEARSLLETISKVNSNGPPKEKPNGRARPPLFRDWFLSQRPEEQEKAWGDRVIAQELLKAGFKPPVKAEVTS